MEDYQKRMVDECRELIERTTKLEISIKNGNPVSPEMEALLDRQLEGMIIYRDALVKRIELLGLADEIYEYPDLEDGEEFETEDGCFKCVGHDDNGCPICERLS